MLPLVYCGWCGVIYSKAMDVVQPQIPACMSMHFGTDWVMEWLY